MNFTDLPWMDALGWVGFAGLLLFYWLLSQGDVLKAYVFNIIGAAAWLVVGVLTWMGYASQLPSLVIMESMVLIMAVRGIIHWRKEKPNDSN